MGRGAWFVSVLPLLLPMGGCGGRSGTGTGGTPGGPGSGGAGGVAGRGAGGEGGRVGGTGGGSAAGAGGGAGSGGLGGKQGTGGAAGANGGASGAHGGAAGQADAGSPAWVDPFGGLSGCPDGGFPVGAPDCGLDMPVSGGVSTVADDYCRNSGSTSWIWYATNGINPDVQINFAQSLVRGVTVANLAASVSFIDRTIGGSGNSWTTPADACTVTIHSNVCWFYDGATYYLISGTGSCAAPATSTPSAAAPPVTIGDFSFTYSIDP